MDYDVDRMLMSDFIQKELILFSRADNVRSIPSLLDGLKPAQRKVGDSAGVRVWDPTDRADGRVGWTVQGTVTALFGAPPSSSGFAVTVGSAR